MTDEEEEIDIDEEFFEGLPVSYQQRMLVSGTRTKLGRASIRWEEPSDDEVDEEEKGGDDDYEPPAQDANSQG